MTVGIRTGKLTKLPEAPLTKEIKTVRCSVKQRTISYSQRSFKLSNRGRSVRRITMGMTEM